MRLAENGYFGLVGITRAENVPVHSPGIYDDASVRTTSVVNPTPARAKMIPADVSPRGHGTRRTYRPLRSVKGRRHHAVEDDMFFAYHGPWERHLQESSWPSQSVEHGLDPSQ
jgi:hypothetical protein